ncbi:MAG TPA: TlpA disulfide reductase family protein [Stellaceae bacterium]|nr:TlpA disulfide reductase family protein [Stellaceae bacterium]
MDDPITRRAAMTIGAAAVVAAGSGSVRAAHLTGTVPSLTGYIGDYYPFDRPQILPPIVIEDVTGKRRNLSDMAGRIVLLNFWATWCAPCLAEMPDLDRLQTHFSDSSFAVLAVCTDARRVQAVSDFLASHGLRNLGVYLDPTGQDLHNCAISAVPTSFIIDRAGHARGILAGAAPWDSQAGHALIDYYLTEAPVKTPARNW